MEPITIERVKRELHPESKEWQIEIHPPPGKYGPAYLSIGHYADDEADVMAVDRHDFVHDKQFLGSRALEDAVKYANKILPELAN